MFANNLEFYVDFVLLSELKMSVEISRGNMNGDLFAILRQKNRKKTNLFNA